MRHLRFPEVTLRSLLLLLALIASPALARADLLTDPDDPRTWQGASVGTFAQLIYGSNTLENRQRIIDDGLLDDGRFVSEGYQPGLLVPTPWTSGGGGCIGRSHDVTGTGSYGYSCGATDLFTAANSIDNLWFQSSGTIGATVFDLGFSAPKAAVFNTIDHGPLPQEAIESTVYLSNDMVDWVQASFERIWLEGFEENLGILWDGYVFAVGTESGESFRYVSIIHGGPGALISDGDDEINGVLALDDSFEPGGADLVVAGVDASGVEYDCQTLEGQGLALASLRNEGQSVASAGFEVLFYFDRDHDGVFDPSEDVELQRVLSVEDVPVGEARTVGAFIDATALFADEPISAWADSKDSILELDEGNNQGTSSVTCVVSGCVGSRGLTWQVTDGGNGHDYRVFSANRVDGITWEESRSIAEDLGGYLATITSAEENAFIFELINDPQYWTINQFGTSGLGPWIGGLQAPGSAEPGEGWAWGTGEPFEFTRWAIGEPNNLFGDESKLQFFSNPPLIDDTWNDLSSPPTSTDRVMAFVVEWDPCPAASLDPTLEWSWTSSPVMGNSLNVMNVPSIVDLNGDGFPEVIFGSTPSTNGPLLLSGVLRVLDGRDGSEMFTVTDSNQRVSTTCSLATGDIDGDGRVEIVACRSTGNQLICFEDDGSLKWISETVPARNWGAISIGDLDGVGLPEIVIGRQVLNADGTRRWVGTGGTGSVGNTGALSLISDVDLDGSPELVAGNTIYNADGSIQLSTGLTDGHCAVGNFDDDDEAEVVLVNGGQVLVYKLDGSVLYGPTSIPGGGTGGPPTVADYDADGEPEIGVAGASRYVVFETDCSVKWSSVTQDVSSNRTGSSVFDFNGDGAAEVVYSDELRLRVYAGVDGEILFSTPLSSCTWHEYPLVADVDADGNAEIIAVANNNCGYGPQRGIYVYGSLADDWVSTRRIWNQHTYHITNVEDDGTIPVPESPNWIQPDLNNFRTQRLPSGQNPLVAPDLTASLLSLNAASCSDLLGMSIRVGNAGGLAVPAGVPVSFSLITPLPEDGPLQALGDFRERDRFHVRAFAVGETAGPIGPGEYEDVLVFATGQFPSQVTITATVDDDGTGFGTVSECREDNNTCTGTFEPAFSGLELVDLLPADGTRLPAGSVVTLSGRAVSTGEELDISGAVVNGQAVDGLDALGNFFRTVTLEEGPNVFAISAFNRCGERSAVLELIGVPPGGDFDQLSEVTGRVAPDYANTTWNHENETLAVELRVCNTDDQALGQPLLAAFESFTIGSVELANPDGFLDTGEPYVAFAEDPDGFLEPDECTEPRVVLFRNPEGRPFSYRLRWLALENGAPYFETVPPTTAVVSAPYAYAPSAVDPEGEALVYALVTGPVGLSADPVTGALAWLPDADDLGTHAVELTATDGHGGRATQRFVIEVLEERPNRPPVFTSAPLLQLPLGAPYVYAATALDPDGDALAFSVLSGPVGLEVSPEGVVTWSTLVAGEYPVELRVEDGTGAGSIQAYSITAGSVASNSGAPQLSGIPPVEVEALDLYFFQPTSFDPDGDVLAFSAPVGPPGLSVDPDSGRVTWIPTELQTGPHPVVLSCEDGQGGSASLEWILEVLPISNRNPSITSLPAVITEIDQPYAYAVTATDPEGEALVFDLVGPPADMQIDPDSGLLTWTPDALGDFLVVVRVTDPAGGRGSQVYTLTVRPPNEPPVITSTPLTTTSFGAPIYYDANATDPDGDPLTWSLTQAPSGMVISAATGLVDWTPGMDQVGDHPVTVRVVDPFGGEDVQAYVITVTPDETDPDVSILFSQQPAFIGQAISVCVLAGDDVGVASRSLSIDSVPVALDGSGCGSYLAMTEGMVTATASATDTSGNSSMTVRMLQVVDPNPENGPVVELLSPAPGAILSTPTNVVATIDDNTPENLVWIVELVRTSDGDRRVLSEGTGPVDAQPLAVIDPTLLSNETYRLEVTGSDGSFSRTRDAELEIVGDLKLGQFQISFTDLVVPTLGIPLAIQRRYDSLRSTTPGPFGHGWDWMLPGRLCDTPDEAPSESLRVDDRVFLTLPDGSRPSFRARYIPSSIFFPFIGSVVFDPEGGVSSTLRPAGGSVVSQSGGTFFASFFGGVYNPDLYVYEDSNLGRFTLSEAQGLLRVEDRNGNSVDITEDGLIHSGGLSVLFNRDDSGRILSVTEPDDPTSPTPPGVVTYDYDELGNLISTTNPSMLTTRYLYEDPDYPHYLTRVEDPLGRPLTRLNYDDEGRLVSMTDADGNTIQLSCDPEAMTETILDGDGNPTIFQYDELGRPLFIVDPLGGQQSFEYDSDGNLTRSTDRMGRTSTFEYDSRGNRTSVTLPYPSGADPANYTTYFDYDEGDRLTAVMRPSGPLVTQSYDAGGNLARLEDSSANPLFQATYDSQGRLLTSRDAAGVQTTYTYDSNGYLASTLDGDDDLITSTYDACGRLMGYGTGGDDEVQLSYLADGRIERVDYGPGNTSLDYGYDASGRLESLSSPTVGAFQRPTTNAGNLAGWTRQDGASVAYAYDTNGRLISETDSLGNLTRYDYDEIGREIEQYDESLDARTTIEYRDSLFERVVTDPEGHQTVFRFDPCCESLESIVDARANEWRFEFSPSSRSRTDPLGRTTVDSLSPGGFVVRRDLPLGVHETYAYEHDNYLADSDTSPTSIVDYAGNRREFGYVDGALAHSTTLDPTELYSFSNEAGPNARVAADPRGEFVRQVLDELGRIERVERSGGVARDIVYGPDSRPARISLSTGQSIDIAYDAAGRETSRVTSDGFSVVRAYRDNGTLETTTDSTGVTRYRQYASGDLFSIEYPSGATVQYVVDRLQDIRSIIVVPVPGGPGYVTTYNYDPNGNLEQVNDPAGGTTTLSYDEANRLVGLALPNGVTTTVDYDDLDRIEALEHRDSAGNPILSFDFDRTGGIGDPKSVLREDGSSTDYQYDSALRLTSEIHRDPADTVVYSRQYDYDSSGNRTSLVTEAGVSTYDYEDGNQLARVTGPAGVETFTYDDGGRLVGATGTGVDIDLDFNAFDELTEATVNGRTTNYAYDGMGRRTLSTGVAGPRELTVGPGLRPGLEVLHAAHYPLLNETYVYAHLGDLPLMRLGPEGPRYYLLDDIGSVRALTDAAGGVTARFDYDAFGNSITTSGIEAAPPSAAAGDFRFHGAWLEAETGFYHMRSRDYDPRTGRFTSIDPEEGNPLFPETFHPYVFAWSNPLLFADPNGRTLVSQATLKRFIALAVRDQVFELGGTIATRIFVTGLQFFAPEIAGFVPLVEGLNGLAAGRRFESLMTGALCGVFGGVGAADYLWFEVSMTRRGRPTADGISCGDGSGPGFTPVGGARPDYVISQDRPTKLRTPAGRPKSFIVGDFKLSIDAMYRDWVGSCRGGVPGSGSKPAQFDAIANHAKRYAFAPVAVHFALRKQRRNLTVPKEACIMQKFLINGVFAPIVGGF